MSQAFRRVARLVHDNPGLLPDLLPTIKRLAAHRIAKEFGSKDELNRYLKDHPGADKSKHVVVEKDKEVRKEEKAKYQQDLKDIGKLSPAAMEEISKHLSKGKAGFGAPTADQIKHHEEATAKKLKSMNNDHSDLKWFVDTQIGPKARESITKAVKKIVPTFKEKPENFSDDEYKEYNRKREAIRGALADFIAVQMFAKETGHSKYKTDKEKAKEEAKD